MISLVVHGGAWAIPDDLVEPHRKGVLEAVKAGWAILKKGGSAIDAVERAILSMENDETFNAGRGAFINAVGDVELDASIMEGKGLKAGAVAAVQNVRNPILLARRIMEHSEHVFLVGMGATRFAREHRIPTCSPDFLVTARELERWKGIQGKGTFTTKDTFVQGKMPSDTVGAVAIDRRGTIVSGTSTGGTPNKYPGRVGDSPLIGCGTYADNEIGGVSATGWGETLIRVAMAKRVVDLMAANGGDANAAVRESLRYLEKRVGGYGGVIVVTPDGQIARGHNTPRMATAQMTSELKSPVVHV